MGKHRGVLSCIAKTMEEPEQFIFQLSCKAKKKKKRNRLLVYSCQTHFSITNYTFCLGCQSRATIHIGRCFPLMNKHFQHGRKLEEPDQPANQSGKVSPNKEAITSRHCSAKYSNLQKNKLETMLKKTPWRPLLGPSCVLYQVLQKAIAYY